MRRVLATVVITVLTVSCSKQADPPKANATDTNVIATVLGKKIIASEKDELNGLISAALLQQLATENKIEPTKEELDAFILKMEEKQKKATLIEKIMMGLFLKQTRTTELQMAKQFVKSWKINKVLYEKYGGRVIFQQAGAEPLDAYRDFLEEQEKKGTFQILDKQYEADFWRYFTNDAMHTFYSEDDGAKFINTPWWMMEEPQAK